MVVAPQIGQVIVSVSLRDGRFGLGILRFPQNRGGIGYKE